ncbi:MULTISPECIES: beta-CASP ribonuclease aCPSF1 [unclassified Methanopyrus]|uniref:beta-CASP ribonuclease aCPSF1 n=1 Tax=Methanopyrus sp. SNP6 TaxID=1937005 RepID=UPI0011E5D435|nr:beta-CASP ribonuclease aCPSF1 [Methanopyrus sp. SNP6]
MSERRSGEKTLEEVKKKVMERVEEVLPSDIVVTDIDFEGPEVVLYTNSPHSFVKDDSDLVTKLAKALRKRVKIRPNPAALSPAKEAKKVILKIIPEEAGVSERDLLFLDTGEVVIFSKKPGLVIGKRGKNVHRISRDTGWVPRIYRQPPIPSKTVNTTRRLILSDDSRRKFLRNVSARIFCGRTRSRGIESRWARVSALGGFQEVGRSSLFLHTEESRVLLDCGVNVAANGTDAYPHFNVPEFRMDDLDAIVITHAHLDHCGFLPYFYRHKVIETRVPVYCTPPTRDLMYLLLTDYIKVLEKRGQEPPYTEKDVKKVIKRTITIDYREPTDITPDMSITFYNAGHILGSASVHVFLQDKGHNFVYTGDINPTTSRLLEGADNRFKRVDSMVVEATYGDSRHGSRRKEENRFRKIVRNTLKKGGKVLIPSFAVGRAQEVMLVLEDMYRKDELEGPVYLDGMIYEATAIHTAYPEYLNRRLQHRILHEDDDPFTSEIFEPVEGSDHRQAIIEDGEPAVILSTSGMLEGGPILEYLRELSDDSKNTLIFVGYQAEGTLGRQIQEGAKEVPLPTPTGKTETLRIELRVETVSGFSGHGDKIEITKYVQSIHPSPPSKVFTNHGEPRACKYFSNHLRRKIRKVFSMAPENLECFRLT